jgi:hypothetical protein
VSYRVTVRTRGSVERSDHARLDDALEALAAAARTAAAEPRAQEIARRWAPEDQVRSRAEVRGPERWRPTTRAGVDVLGDGSLLAWTGAPERKLLEPGDGEDPISALRRVLTG